MRLTTARAFRGPCRVPKGTANDGATDGTTIAFTRERWVQAKGEDYFVPVRTIYLARANGKGVRRLTAWQPLP
jgi:hypothetical protein